MNGNKRKVLVVDDEAGIVEELVSFLKDEGYEVRSALDGKEGLKILSVFDPEVIVTDLKLPDMSGLEILKKAKSDHPKTRVIVSTGYVDQTLIDKAEELGRDVFVQKPFDLEAIKYEIDRLLEEF
jgi:DNA-binding NtrC family response regulator